MTTPRLPTLEAHLATLGQRMDVQYGKSYYRRLIEGECTARRVTCLSPDIPGQLRLASWVCQDIASRPEYTPRRRDDLCHTFETRRQLIDARLEAGGFHLEAVIGRRALAVCGEAYAAEQADLLKRSLVSPNCSLYIVEDAVLARAMRRLDLGDKVTHTTALAGVKAGPPHALYVEREFVDATQDHEEWSTNLDSFIWHQRIFSRLAARAFSTAEAHQVLDDGVRRITS